MASIGFISKGSGGTNTSDATAVASDILLDKTAYIAEGKVTGSMPNNGDVTITPSASLQTKSAGYYNSIEVPAVTSSIDANIKAENIKSGVTILGVTGNVEAAIDIAPTNTFVDATAKQFYDIQTAYDAMSPRVLTDTDKTIDKSIYCIPEKSNGTPLIDTSRLTSNTYRLFKGCSNLKKIPSLNLENILGDGSSNATISEMFESCSNLENIGDLLIGDKTIGVNDVFNGCSKLKKIPKLVGNIKVKHCDRLFNMCTLIEEIPALDTSLSTSFTNFCYKCTNLKTVPVLDLSSASKYRIGYMFTDCPNLTDDSLNNIMASLLTATAYTGTKTLKEVGLSSAQANKCKTLSNWTDFEAAGWATGY